MSLCDRCVAPGACCRNLALTGGNLLMADLIAADAPEESAQKWLDHHGFPMFRPARVFGHAWRFDCTALGADGRCTIYEDRPDLCRRYEPEQDGLCVHFNGVTDAGDASAGEMVADQYGRERERRA